MKYGGQGTITVSGGCAQVTVQSHAVRGRDLDGQLLYPDVPVLSRRGFAQGTTFTGRQIEQLKFDARMVIDDSGRLRRFAIEARVIRSIE